MGPWQVRLGYEVTTDSDVLLIFRRLDSGEIEAVTEINDGLMTATRHSREAAIPALVRFDPLRTEGMLPALAAALAQRGFGRLDTTETGKAMQAHIASAEKQAERLFVLADRLTLASER